MLYKVKEQLWKNKTIIDSAHEFGFDEMHVYMLQEISSESDRDIFKYDSMIIVATIIYRTETTLSS